MHDRNWLQWVPVNQNWLTERMRLLGYKIDNLGVCFGITHMAMQAVLAEDLQSFDDRLINIALMKPQEFKNIIAVIEKNRLNLVQQVKSNIHPFQSIPGESEKQTQERLYLYNKFVNSKIQQKFAELSKQELIDMEIQAFLDGVIVYQTASTREHYEYLFPDNIDSELQKRQFASTVMIPKELETTSKPEPGLVQIGEFSGAYTLDELTAYFQTLREACMKANPHKPTVLTLSAMGHIIMVGYDPFKQQWLFMNANQLAKDRYVSSAEQMSTLVNQALLSNNDKTVFITRMYGTKSMEPQLTKCMEAWKADETWQQMHTVSDEKAKYYGFFGTSWLLCAANTDDLNLVNDLLAHRAEADHPGMNEITALRIAVGHRNIGVTKALLEHNADPNLPKYGFASLLYVAANAGNTELVRLLLAAKANPNIGYNDVTPLHIAAQKGHTAIVQLLLSEQNTYPDSKLLIEGVTPLHYAATNGHLEIVRALLDHKANPDLASTEKITPLLSAALQDNTPSATILLEHNADPNRADDDGVTPLYVATINNNVELARSLLTHQADPDVKQKNGFTPLYIAAAKGSLGIIKLLLEKNADVMLTYRRDISVLRQLAKKTGRTSEMETMIRQKNPDGKAKSIMITAVEIARVLGHDEAAKLIQSHIDSLRQTKNTGLDFFASANSTQAEGIKPVPTPRKIR